MATTRRGGGGGDVLAAAKALRDLGTLIQQCGEPSRYRGVPMDRAHVLCRLFPQPPDAWAEALERARTLLAGVDAPKDTALAAAVRAATWYVDELWDGPPDRPGTIRLRDRPDPGRHDVPANAPDVLERRAEAIEKLAGNSDASHARNRRPLPDAESKALEEVERLKQRREAVGLARTLGSIRKAAAELGMKRSTLGDWVKAEGGLTVRDKRVGKVDDAGEGLTRKRPRR